MGLGQVAEDVLRRDIWLLTEECWDGAGCRVSVEYVTLEWPGGQPDGSNVVPEEKENEISKDSIL